MDDDDTCCVCTEKFQNEDEPLKCGHRIHMSCIYKSGKAQCPLCRHQLSLTKTQWQKMSPPPQFDDEMDTEHFHIFIGPPIPSIVDLPRHASQYAFGIRDWVYMLQMCQQHQPSLGLTI